MKQNTWCVLNIRWIHDNDTYTSINSIHRNHISWVEQPCHRGYYGCFLCDFSPRFKIDLDIYPDIHGLVLCPDRMEMLRLQPPSCMKMKWLPWAMWWWITPDTRLVPIHMICRWKNLYSLNCWSVCILTCLVHFMYILSSYTFVASWLFRAYTYMKLHPCNCEMPPLSLRWLGHVDFSQCF